MSYPEVLLWQRLRGGATGAKFRKQHPIGPYVVDFCCLRRRLVVEVDGQIHDEGRQTEQDARRDAFLGENGYQVVRVRAADVLRDVEFVAGSIAVLAAAPPPPCFAWSPSPCRGG
ncbi:MAG: endonuclease domain-containing protein [Sphingomonas sp.]